MSKRITVDPTKCAAGCRQPIFTISSGEVWHESCYQLHRGDVQTDGKPCDNHALCRKYNAEHKAKLKLEFNARKKAKDAAGYTPTDSNS